MRRRTRGAALLITVWLVALASELALNYARTTRNDTKISASQLARHQARAAAEAGIWRAVYEIDTPDPTLPWPTNGEPVIFDFNGVTVTAIVQDVTGLVDLNAGSAKALTTVLAYALEDDTRALNITDAILDWRDRDNAVTGNGAEDADYAGLGLSYEAKDAAFNTREELQLVMGVSAQDYHAIAPYLTVYAQRKSVNVGVAPLRILAATGLNDEQGSDNARGATGDSSQPTGSRVGRSSSRRRGTTFEIFTRVLVNGVTSRLAATVQINRSRRRGPKVAVLAWHETWPIEIPLETLNENPPNG